MRKILTFLFLILLSWQWALSQPMKRWIVEGDSAFAKNEYYTAFKYYEIALEYPKPPADLRFKYAESARQSNAYPIAEQAYQQTLEGADSSHHAAAMFWLAAVQQRRGKYKEALEHYGQFLERYAKAAPAFASRAEKGKQDCAWAIQMGYDQTQPDTNHLGREVNTLYSEFAPLQRGDTLYYSSLSFYTSDSTRLYSQVKRAVGMGDGEVLPGFNLDKQHTANLAFSPDGKTAYFTRCEYNQKGEIRCDIYSRRRLGGDNWDTAVRLAINDTTSSTTQPSLGIDKRTGETRLYFSSNRRRASATAGERPDFNLYYSVIGANGTPGTPVFLEGVNTAGDEITPFFHSLSQQLYFSSNGHLGLGGFDIYQTQQTGSSWRKAQHMSPPMSSSYDDAYFSLTEDGSRAAFSSARLGSSFIEPDKEACCYDIYSRSFNISVDLLANVFNACPPYQPLEGATIRVIDSEGRELPATVNAGRLEARLQLYGSYRLEASFAGLQASESFSIDSIPASGRIEKRLDLRIMPETCKLTIRVYGVTLSENEQRDTARLDGAIVRLFSRETGGTFRLQEELLNAAGNQFSFDIRQNLEYRIEIERPLYAFTESFSPLLQPFRAAAAGEDCNWTMSESVYMDYEPIEIYFDNDVPGPQTYTRNTTLEYAQLYANYYQRKQTFLREYAGDRYFAVRTQLDSFFERDVRRDGYERLQTLTDKLLTYLKKNKAVEIEIGGYASPLGNARYNDFLSWRRINSIQNFLLSYRQGTLKPYEGKIALKGSAFGEPKGTAELKDKFNNRKDDIFGLQPSLERRVVIFNVKIKDIAPPEQQISSER